MLFKLTRFQAVNVIGFVSGLSKKNFVLDLQEFKHKDLLVITGANASGKSTFLSLVHPSHVPSDDRSKFIVPGKEGSLIRTYEGDDGTIIVSKCIYKPKDETTHLPKCYLSIQRPGDEQEIEMNPNGNVTSYNSLLHTYFGISKDYLNFASYSDAMAGIVNMSDTERKNSVSNMIPNTSRFEIAYNTINEKYRELRNMIRNLSQKILAIRDEESLTADLARVSAELNKAHTDRDEYVRKFSKAEGRVKELSHGNDLKAMINQYNEIITDMAQFDSDLEREYSKLLRLYDKLDITPKENSVEFEGMDQIDLTITKYERKIARSDAIIQSASTRIDEIRNQIFKLERDITDAESVIFGLQTQDVQELERTRDNYISQLKSLRYSADRERYEEMSYDEIVTFSRTVAMLDHMIQALFDEYGQMVTRYFEIERSHQDYNTEMGMLTASIETKTEKRDSLYRKLIEKEQYRKFQDILDQRPVTCHNDSCPFIANALKWQHIAGEIAELSEQYKQLGIEITTDNQRVDELDKELKLKLDMSRLMEMIQANLPLFKRYLNVDLEQIKSSIRHGMWKDVMDIIKLKSIASILSEKDLYIRITTMLLPDVEHSIEIAKVYGTNRDLVKSQLDKLNLELSAAHEELQRYRMEAYTSDNRKELYVNKLNLWRKVKEQLDAFRNTAEKRVRYQENAEVKRKEIETINQLVDNCREYDRKISEAELIISELTPVKQQIQMDMSTLIHLHEEKAQIEQDFIVVEVLRSIAQPGKGIRKELINIYMYDIYQTANQLLLNTFEGKLYLKEFIITDKEFVIPYVYNGAEGSDIAYASSSQQSTIAMALSLAIMSKLIDKYGVITIDEADRALSAENKAIFIDILTKQLKYIGVSQAFVITHSPEYYMNGDTGFLLFPGSKVDKKGLDYIEVG